MHATAGDVTTGRLLVETLIWTGSTTAADDLACKNGAGTVLLAIKSGAVPVIIKWPFGREPIDGLESDVLDAGTVEYVFA
jgi:hypothetical protein